MARGSIGRALLAVMAVALCGTDVSRSEPLVLIVSSRWERARPIELRDLRQVYLGGRTRLFGERVRRVDLPPGSPSREGFIRSVLGRPEQELERYWIEQALSGGALPPRQLATPGDVIAAVGERVGILGYVPASALREEAGAARVRVLPVVVAGQVLDASDARYPVQSRD